MKIFSTFTGIGGFEVGISNAFEATRILQGVNNTAGETSDSRGPVRSEPSVVGYSEVDKYAISVYERHFPGVKNYGDITKINENELPDFDCLVGGFPCQAFSVAGKRRGFEDTRGTLFFDLARILKAKKPHLFVFENVDGLRNHDEGRTFVTILAAIDELGYDAQWQVINSKYHGVPQNRKRIIIVGHLRGERRPQVFPLGAHSEADIVLPTLTTRYAGAQANGGYIGTESPKVGTGEIEVKAILDDETWAKRHDSIRRVYGTEGIAPTVPTGTGGGVMPKIEVDEIQIRRLTPLECERLQAFPDNWTQMGMRYVTDNHGKLTQEPYIVSDTQRYKMCGNAVTTNVIQAVFERIFMS